MATRLVTPAAPRLPNSVLQFDRQFMDEYSRILGLYFRQMDAVNTSLLGTRGGRYLDNPYGAFSNATTQALTSANTPYVVNINTTDHANGTSLASNQITVAQTGLYNVQFSLQFENTTTQITEVWVWLRTNGVDVPGTASIWAVTGSHGGVNGYTIGACNFYADLSAGDYLELVAAANATGLNIESYTSSTSPFTRPSIPGAVVTVSFVSAVP